jgi:hypothetical protein
MSQIHADPVVSQDTWPSDDTSPSNVGSPISQAEIEELMYNEQMPRAERLSELRALRDDLLGQEAADLGEDDPKSLLASIEQAIDSLEFAENGGEGALLEMNRDPTDHMETLSPDDDLVFEAEAEAEMPEDEAEAIADRDAENDGHDGRQGYHAKARFGP